MDNREYEKMMDALPTTGVFVIREDNHEILYYNQRVKEISPEVRKGMPCHELGNHSCINCPILTIGDRQENQTINYNNPFGEMVDITAVRTKWENEIPAFIITAAPHIQAISHGYHKILRVNLTRDQYEVVKIRPEDRGVGYNTDSFSSWLGQFIYDGGIHSDDMKQFISFTHPDHIKRMLKDGQEMLSCCYRRKSGDDFRWNLMEIVPDSVGLDNDQYIFIYVKDVHDILRESLELDDTSIRIQEVIRTLGEQNFCIYGIDLETGETNLVRENGHTHTGWKSWTVQWSEIMESRLNKQIHPVDWEKFCQMFSLEGLRQVKETSVQKADMLCQWRGEEDREYRYMAVIAYFSQQRVAQNYVILALQNVDKRVRQEHTLSLRDMQLAAILKSRYSVMTTVYLENGQCERVWINEDHEIHNVASGNYNQYFHKALESMVHPEDAESFKRVMSPEHMYQKAAGVQDYEEEICQYRMAGTSLRWLEQHVIYARQGNRIGVNILGRDITREKLEEELRLKEEKEQEDIIRSLGGMFFATYYADLEEDKFRSVTQLQEVEQTLDGTVDYATGLKAYAENFVHPDDREEYLNMLSIGNLRRTLDEKHPFVTVAYRKMPDSTDTKPEDYGWIRSTAVMSQTDADGKVRSIVYAAQDVTESKRKEMREQQALQAACEAADHANAFRHEFLSSMSHNIRTPLNGVIGMLKIAEDNLNNQEKTKEYLEKASESSRQLLSMLNEILDISLINSGGFNLKTEAFNLPELMEQVVSDIQPYVREKGLSLELHPIQAKHEDVLGDKQRLEQIFLNILGNSVKYTPFGGKLEILVTEHREFTEHGCSSYDFIFTDNGIGMEEEFVRRIFEPFSRAEDWDKGYSAGVGLGMPIAQNIARMMGGAISVKSRPGEGSRFVVTVILRRQSLPEHSDELPDMDGRNADEISLQGRRILLVEDNELNQEIAMELIGETGAMVECAEDGKEGLQRFVDMPEGYYDLILMDIQMPVMNGLEATRAIRKIPRADAAVIPIIALSANTSPDDMAAGREAGMNGHLAKPLDISAFAECVDYLLQYRA